MKSFGLFFIVASLCLFGVVQGKFHAQGHIAGNPINVHGESLDHLQKQLHTMKRGFTPDLNGLFAEDPRYVYEASLPHYAQLSETVGQSFVKNDYSNMYATYFGYVGASGIELEFNLWDAPVENGGNFLASTTATDLSQDTFAFWSGVPNNRIAFYTGPVGNTLFFDAHASQGEAITTSVSSYTGDLYVNGTANTTSDLDTMIAISVLPFLYVYDTDVNTSYADVLDVRFYLENDNITQANGSVDYVSSSLDVNSTVTIDNPTDMISDATVRIYPDECEVGTAVATLYVEHKMNSNWNYTGTFNLEIYNESPTIDLNSDTVSLTVVSQLGIVVGTFSDYESADADLTVTLTKITGGSVTGSLNSDTCTGSDLSNCEIEFVATASASNVVFRVSVEDECGAITTADITVTAAISGSASTLSNWLHL